MTVLSAPELLTRQQAADYLGVKKETLDKWASTGRHGLRFIKKGPRFIRYRQSDLEAFLNAGTVSHSSAATN